MIAARQKILVHLNKIRAAAPREIARALQMSAAAVRHHLRALVAEGRLEVATVRGRGGRGRPEKVYSMARSLLGDNLSALAEALLTEAGRSVRVEALASRLADGADLSDHPIARRLNLTVEKLNQMKYHARWEAGPAGPRVIFGHCPYAAIIEKHPELCKMDAALLKELMGQSAEQLTKIGREGATACVFALGR